MNDMFELVPCPGFCENPFFPAKVRIASFQLKERLVAKTFEHLAEMLR